MLDIATAFEYFEICDRKYISMNLYFKKIFRKVFENINNTAH